MKKNNRFLSKQRVVLTIVLVATFFSVTWFFEQDTINEHLFFLSIALWIGILISTGQIDSLYQSIIKDAKSTVNKNLMKQRFVVFVIWAASILSAKQIGWIGENVHPSIILFGTLVSGLWLFNISSRTTVQLALLFLIFTAVFAHTHMQATVLFAELTYLWIAISVIMFLTSKD